jgi:hypothetical protein
VDIVISAGCELDAREISFKASRKEERSKSCCEKKQAPPKEKRAGRQALLQKLCRPYFPENLDLILI